MDNLAKLVIVDPLHDRPLDWTLKGLRADWAGRPVAQIVAQRPSLFDDQIMFPAAIMLDSVVQSNRAWMRRFLQHMDVKIAPHGKTTLAPQLFRMQAEDGAWAITAATAHHAKLYRRFGVSRILLANQLVGAGNIAWVMREQDNDPDFDFYCLVDTVDGVEDLRRTAERQGAQRPLQVLVEVGRSEGRCGVRSVDQGLLIARAAAAAAPWLELAGVETFEGISHSTPESVSLARQMLGDTVRLAHLAANEGLFRPGMVLLTAGGSNLHDVAALILKSDKLAGRAQVVLRSGCYISHDDGLYARLFEQLRDRMPEAADFGPPPAGALQVWAHVQSLPEAGSLICSFGRRDVGSETDLPRPLFWARPGDPSPQPIAAGFETKTLFDQHAVLSTPLEHPLKHGDLIGFGVSHPCTTFDKWRAILVVNDEWQVKDVIRTYF